MKRNSLFAIFLLSAMMTSGCCFDPYQAGQIAYGVGDLLSSGAFTGGGGGFGGGDFSPGGLGDDLFSGGAFNGGRSASG